MSDQHYREDVEAKRADEPISELKGERRNIYYFSLKKVQFTDEQLSKLQREGKIACHITVTEEDELTDVKIEAQREDCQNDCNLLILVVSVPFALVMFAAIFTVMVTSRMML